jgi:hypothetical protein
MLAENRARQENLRGYYTTQLITLWKYQLHAICIGLGQVFDYARCNTTAGAEMPGMPSCAPRQQLRQ